jgi:hypothetical protein
MGKKAPKPPPAPDPVKTAAAQTESNVQTARVNANLNRLDETDPLGSVRYTDLGGDRWRKDTTLSDVGQRQFDLQNQVDEGTNRLALQGVGQAGKVLGKSFTLDGLTPEASKGSIEADRARYEDALSSRLEPQFAQDRAAAEQRMADQGIPMGSEAYNRGMDELNRAKTDARMQVISQGGAEGRAQDASVSGLRQRQLQEALLQRSQPINEIGALMGTGQVGLPNFGATSNANVANTDVMGPINQQYASQMAGWNAKNQAKQSFQNGLFNLAGAAGSAAIMSDRRVKEDIKRIGTADNGIPLYSYRYIGQPAVHIGTMAQDVERSHPDAVVEFDGVKHVDYGKLFN